MAETNYWQNLKEGLTGGWEHVGTADQTKKAQDMAKDPKLNTRPSPSPSANPYKRVK